VNAFGAGREEIVVSGKGAVVGESCDSAPFLKSPKTRKFMGRQDELAVVAAARALESAALSAPLGERCGLYLSIGFIPFEGDDLDLLVASSIADEGFSMARFSTEAFFAVNPLLTFRCLPNMPAFHVSLAFDIQGPYVVGYPGTPQFYLALEDAFAALASGAIDVALAGAVADQGNLLVRHHFSRLEPPVDASRLASAAAFLVLERRVDVERRGGPIRGRLVDADVRYSPFDPLESPITPMEEITRNGIADRPPLLELGPASLGVALTDTDAVRLEHTMRSRDGFTVSSRWELC
jgi:3-oxoacyl-(acyl-carrier-protein) synthase